ncbi:retention module-containing protein, partial [Vibrio ostreicida]
MNVQVARQERIVEELTGEVIAVQPDGKARQVAKGDTIQPNEILITAQNASVVLGDSAASRFIGQNALALDIQTDESDDRFQVTEVEGNIGFDLSLLGEGALNEDDITAIQDAILGGADPTQILEATAAGAGGANSANGGFVTIDYNGTEVLASTFFETASQPNALNPENDNEVDEFVYANGGERVSGGLVEGSLSAGTYPQSQTGTILVSAGNLALDPTSFVPDSTSLASLLAELNSEVSSSGKPVSFTYDATDNAIIGVNDQGEVLRIVIDATQVGKDVSLDLTTTISQPIDHLNSIGAGQVAINGDQISVSFEITGMDSGGNALQSPIDAQVSITDGLNPTPQDSDVAIIESNSAVVEGDLVEIGSDALLSVIFDSQALQQFDGLLSDNQTTSATLSDDGSTITLTIDGSGEPVLTVSVDTQGHYHYQQFKPLEHSQSDTISLSLPTRIVDFDQDTVTNTINISISDGMNPVITHVDRLTSIDESGLSQGSLAGSTAISGSGRITVDVGSDMLDHFELAPDEFNTDGSLTSQGQEITLELTSEVNGVRTYAGVIDLNGTRVPVFEVKIDSPTQGKYEFTLLESLDHLGTHEASLVVELPVYAVDADGDRSELVGGGGVIEAAKIIIDVKDDGPTISAAQALHVEENDLSSGSSPESRALSQDGTFTTVEGADRV